MRFSFVTAVCAIALLAGCNRQKNAVSGTIEVDEVHVASRSPGRVEKIFAWEGDTLKTGDVIVQLEASEMQARRALAAAQINTAQHDVEAQAAQLEFLKADAARQQDLLKRNTVSPSEAERATSAAKRRKKVSPPRALESSRRRLSSPTWTRKFRK
ncbi:MAG TPA: biotin/lipoyl-binding protein [Chthoniobacterales bacterium]